MIDDVKGERNTIRYARTVVYNTGPANQQNNIMMENLPAGYIFYSNDTVQVL